MASIKGMALQSVTEDVHRLRMAGRITPADLVVRLKEEDQAVLEELTSPSLWYPIGTYGRLLDLLCDVDGGGDESYLVERGARAAERLMQVGPYRHVLQSAERWGDRAGQMMIQLSAGFYDFTHWTLRDEDDGERYVLEVTEAADFPDSARRTAQGFVQVLFARMGGKPVTVRSRRPSPDRFLYEVTQQR